MSSCSNSVLPSNPDVSGVGVRSAIYLQNLLCIIPAILAFADGEVTEDELGFVQSQSLSNLTLSFSISISAIVQARTFGLSPYHAMIILSMCLTNGTNTIVYSVLLLQHISQSSAQSVRICRMREQLGLDPVPGTQERENTKEPIDWEPRGNDHNTFLHKILFSLKDGWTQNGPMSPSFKKRLKELLTFQVGSIASLHSALMATLGIWLWSDPYAFGGTWNREVVDCVSLWLPIPIPNLPHIQPLVIPLSSNELRRASLLIFSFVMLLCLFSLFRRVFSHATERFIYKEWEAHQTNNTRQSFLVISRVLFIVFVLVLNIGFISHIEMTLRFNRHLQSSNEADWSFGQTLALLVLIKPIRDTIAHLTVRPEAVRIREETEKLKAAIEQNGVPHFIGLVDDGADVNVVAVAQYPTALQAVAGMGDVKTLQRLLNRGAKVDLHVEYGQYATALQVASFLGYLDIVKALLDAGADPNAQGGQYGTALAGAAFAGHLAIVEHLLENKADANLVAESESSEYRTALQAASYSGHDKVVALLLQKGADPNAEGGQHGTALQAALHLARRERPTDAYVASPQVDPQSDIPLQIQTPMAINVVTPSAYGVVVLLLEHGANPNFPGREFGSVLQAACVHAWADIVRALLEKGADPNIRAGALRTPLEICCEYSDRARREGLEERVAEYHAIEILLLNAGAEKRDHVIDVAAP